MKNLLLLLCCLFLGCFGGGTGTPTGGAAPGPTNPGSVADGGGASAPGGGSGDAAAAGPEGVAPAEDHQDIEEYPKYALKFVDDTVETSSVGTGLPIDAEGKVRIKGLVEKWASLDGQVAFDGPYALAPAGEKILLVLFSDPDAEVVEYQACVTTVLAVEPVTEETAYEEALKRRNLDVTFLGFDGWYVRLFAIPWADTGSIVDCQKKLVSVPAALSALEPPDGYRLKTFPLVMPLP